MRQKPIRERIMREWTAYLQHIDALVIHEHSRKRAIVRCLDEIEGVSREELIEALRTARPITQCHDSADRKFIVKFKLRGRPLAAVIIRTGNVLMTVFRYDRRTAWRFGGRQRTRNTQRARRSSRDAERRWRQIKPHLRHLDIRI